jgi:GT2 family glycosyltransferase
VEQPRQSLAVHTVVYLNEFNALERALKAVIHSVSRAQKNNYLEGWVIRWGDCSPQPSIASKELGILSQLAIEAGGTFEYRFFDQNLGSAAGHNALASQSTEELLVILNPDAEVSPNCIERLIGTLGPDVGSVEARQLPLEHPKEYNPQTLETSWSSTACLLTKKAAFDEVEGFDSKTFFLYCDDVDYSWQLKLHGWKVLYQPAATVFHDKRLSVKGEWLATPSESYYSAEAALLLAHKYSRQELLRHLSNTFSDGTDEQRKALKEFHRRKSAELLVSQVDQLHKASQFIEGNYAPHRF